MTAMSCVLLQRGFASCCVRLQARPVTTTGKAQPHDKLLGSTALRLSCAAHWSGACPFLQLTVAAAVRVCRFTAPPCRAFSCADITTPAA
jgi:hypothetical protein